MALSVAPKSISHDLKRTNPHKEIHKAFLVDVWLKTEVFKISNTTVVWTQVVCYRTLTHCGHAYCDYHPAQIHLSATEGRKITWYGWDTIKGVSQTHHSDIRELKCSLSETKATPSLTVLVKHTAKGHENRVSSKENQGKIIKVSSRVALGS